MYQVYILQSEQNGRYYIGSTNDVARRLQEHNTGLSRSTKPYRPWRIVWTKQCDSIKEAKRIETEIKQKKSRVSIQRYILTRP